MPTIITAMDSTTHVTISGASIFVNGQGVGSTDNTGQFSLTLNTPIPMSTLGPMARTYSLSIKISGYNTFSKTGLIEGFPVAAFLEAATVDNQVNFRLNINPEAAANGVVVSFDDGGTPVLAAYVFGGLSVKLSSGPQTITANIATYQPVSAVIDTTQTTAKSLQLISLTDTGVKQPISQQTSLTPTSDQLLPAIARNVLPECIPPNNGQGTYFTMTQARVYIGDIFIDELNYCQFILQNNKIPIYGYASRDFDNIAQGKSLVQGQFGINFISEGYLFTALKEYNDLSGSGNVVDATTDTTTQNQATLLSLVNKMQNPDPSWTPAMFTTAKAQINQLVIDLGPQGPQAIQSAKAGIDSAIKKQSDSILGLPGGDYNVNATYNDIEFDIVIQYTGAGRTITRRIERCHLISNESIMDHSGTPIIDSYGFIARRLR